MRVAIGRQHLKDTVFHAQDGDIEGAAAEVVDRDDAGVPFVEAVRKRCGSRLVDDPQHFEAGDAAGVARRGPLRVVEIRRHGDHSAIDLGIDVTVRREECLGAVLQVPENERRDFRWGELAIAEPDPDDTARAGLAADPERQVTRLTAHFVGAFPHESLHGVHGALRIGQQAALRLAADVNRPVVRDRDDRRHKAVAAAIADHDRHAVLHVRDERIRSAEIDPNDSTHGSTESTQRTPGALCRIPLTNSTLVRYLPRGS